MKKIYKTEKTNYKWINLPFIICLLDVPFPHHNAAILSTFMPRRKSVCKNTWNMITCGNGMAHNSTNCFYKAFDVNTPCPIDPFPRPHDPQRLSIMCRPQSKWLWLTYLSLGQLFPLVWETDMCVCLGMPGYVMVWLLPIPCILSN